MLDSTRDALVGRLSEYDRVVEVGIGREPAVAARLARAGVVVTATDICPCVVPPEVTLVIDDITAPELPLYADAGAIYGLNLPPELHRPALDVARTDAADLLFTTLGNDPPTIPVAAETLPAETLYVSTR